MRAKERYRYEELTGFITALIDGGALAPGARVPSVRRISAQRKVSLSTVLQAYRLLEDRGVIEARPQSGFYVVRRPAGRLQRPAVSKPPRRAAAVTVSGLVLDLLEYAADPRLVPLGCAIPSAELLAAGRLDRFLARAARLKGTEHNIYTHPKGEPRLRQEIARRAAQWGQALSPDDIVITCGCTEALMLALRAVTRPGDTWRSNRRPISGCCTRSRRLGSGRSSCRRIDERHRSRRPVGRARTRAGRACLFSSSFNNPLGCTMPDDKKRAVLDLMAEHDVPLIEDESTATSISTGSGRAPTARSTAMAARSIAARSPRRSRRAIASAGSSPGAISARRSI